MNDRLRRISRIKGSIIGLALTAALGAAGSAPAQFGQAAGFSEIMNSYYIKRDLPLFVEGLRLDEGQSVILESLFYDYLDENETGRDQMIERLTNMREELQTIDRERILKIIFVPFEEWSAEWDSLNEQFIESVKAILNDRQLDRWPRFDRQLTREKQLPKGKYSGEELDLVKIIRELDLELPTRTIVEPVLDDYELHMDEALSRRESLIRQSRLLVMGSMRDEDPHSLLSTYNRQIAARIDVRNVNDQFVEVIAAALPGAYGPLFRQTALERAYPRIYMATPAERIFAAAVKLEGLSAETLQAILDLQRDYLAELALINDSLAALLRDYEPKNDRYRAESYALRGTGQRPDRPRDPTREEFRRRDELDKRYIELLRALLTDEQFGSLPGIQRFVKTKPRTARPGSGDNSSELGTEGGGANLKGKTPAKGAGLSRGGKGKGSERDGPK